MNITNDDIDELGILQPELNVIGNVISGCFYVNACVKNKTKGRGEKLALHPWDAHKTSNQKHIKEYFYVDITLDESMYPYHITETSGKLLLWGKHISPEFWHIYSNDTLCVGIKSDIEQKQQNSNSYAIFINQLLTEYFYYMCYVKDFGNEPWKAHRHGLFKVLEVANEDMERNMESTFKIMDTVPDNEWEALLNKTKALKLKNNSNCPFCQTSTLVRDCKFHKKQIRGYNKIIQYLYVQQSKK